MATLTSFLPAPVQPSYSVHEEHALFQPEVSQPGQKVKKQIPRYGERQGFVPRTAEDFGDGGAFPEIHVAQYPLDMGKKKANGQSSALIPVTLDTSGRVKHEAILGHGNKKIFSQYTDLMEKQTGEEELVKPTEEEIDAVTARTRAALETLISGKIAAAQPAALGGGNNGQKAPTYIKYTPTQQGAQFNSGASSRIIRMVEMPKDPLEPSKFKNKRVPKGPPSPPVPIMHSPPRKVTVKDQQLWKIPPCISNWKNSKGYTIPLDKRLAADGRGLQEVAINDKFAKLSESLYVAERTAREEVTARAQISKKVSMHEKERREEMLRKLAEDARSHRGGGGGGGGERAERGRGREDAVRDEEPEEEEEENDEDRKVREQIRRERALERQRELRLEAAGKQGKSLRDEDRDISEKIALGQAAAGPRSDEALFDQRLFNQTQGLDTGFGDDDDYSLYSKPLFSGSSANAIYRPKKNEEEWGSEELEKAVKTNKFRPDKEFDGVDRSKPSEPRNKPVEFEKQEEDLFGLDEFLNNVKKSSGNKRPLDHIGTRGALHAGSTGSGNYQDQDKNSKRKKIDFDSSKSDRRR